MTRLNLLKRLFSLKYLHGVTDLSTLAEQLEIHRFQVLKLERALEEHLKAKIKTITPDRLELICPECLEASVYYDPERNERYCGKCGAVLQGMAEFDMSLPYDTTYALTSELATDRSLGAPLNGKALMRVIAKSPASEVMARNGNMDLGLRARQLKIITETFEHPALQRAIRKATRLSQKYSLDGDKIFNQTLGKNVRDAFTAAYIRRDKSLMHHIAETCFWLTLRQHGKNALARTFTEETKINKSLAVVLSRFDAWINDIKKCKLTMEALEMLQSL